MKPSIEVDVLTISLPIEHRPKPKAWAVDGLTLEVRSDALWAWDEPCRLQSTVFAFEPEDHPIAFGGIDQLPHLDDVYRYVVEQQVANRDNLIGAHLKAAAEAMETAIVNRDGSSVYFADAGGQIKIGWSRKVSARLAQLQTGSAFPIKLLATIPGGLAAERRIHQQFAHLRTQGEWFVAAPELLEFAAKARADYQTKLTAEEA